MDDPYGRTPSLQDMSGLGLKADHARRMIPQGGEDDEPLDSTQPTSLALRQAASFVDDARADRREMHMIDPQSLRLYFLYHSKGIRFAIRLMLLIQVFLLPLVEEPQTLSFPLWLPPLIELGVVLVYFLALLLSYSFLVPGSMTQTRQVAAKNAAFLVCNLLIITDIIMWYITFYGLGWGIRWSRVLRPYSLVFFLKPIRLAMYTIIKMLRSLAEILALILFIMCIYALVSYLLFLDTREGHLYMSSYWHSFLSFYILMTTANFPDVMMPAYEENHWTCIIFISYLVFVTYFLLNMVLALIFNTYSRLMRRKLNKIILFERKRVYFAFALLDPSESGAIPFLTWRRFMKVIQPNFSLAKTAFLFRLVNTSGSGSISVNEFLSITTILRMHIYKSRKAPHILKRACPSLYGSKFGQFFVGFTLSKWFDRGMMMIVVSNVIVIVMRYLAVRDCQGSLTGSELGFLIIFCFELLVKVIADGPRAYFMSGFNMFVLFLSLFFCIKGINSGLRMSVAILVITWSQLVVALTSDAECRSLFLKFLYFAPILRLFRLLHLSEFFERLVQTFVTIFPALLTFVGMQFLTFYVWVIVGMEIWAGQIYKGNPALLGTAFDAADFYENNFNNFLLSYVTVFELMVVNNWQQIASGYVAISGEIAWLFFISFNACVVIVVVSWVVASIIESFQVHNALEEQNYQAKVQHDVNHLNELFSSELDFVWKARFKRRFRTELQIMFNNEQTDEYVRVRLGAPEEATRIARSALIHLVGGKEIYLSPTTAAAASKNIPDGWLYD